MGLDIFSKSKFDYHAGYSGIHALRYLSYKICEGKLDYIEYMRHDEDARYDWAYFEHLLRFPNLNWHSDCDGEYTKTGKVCPFYTNKKSETQLMTGNSIELLAELEEIKKHRKEFADQTRGWQIFDMLYPLVKDVVENHDGKLRFC